MVSRANENFFLVATDPTGQRVQLLPGLDHDLNQPLQVSHAQAQLIRESTSFREGARTLLNAHPDGFTTELEFDVYPLMLNWIASDPFSGVLNMMQVTSGTGLMSYLTVKDGFEDQGVVNLFTGFQSLQIDSFADLMARYTERPLAFISFYSPDSWNAMLTAAVISFAAARFEFAQCG